MKSATIFLLTTMLVSIAAPAWADDDAQSRAYFETGAKAYEKGDYVNAIRAFEQAYALTKRPGLIFSIAQSYKRQYAVDSNPAHLRKSLEYYRRFLTEDKGGKRRADATNSIMEVEAILGRLPAEQQVPPPQTVETPQPTLISITTQVDEATISIDDAAPRSLEPVEVKPGKHKIVLQAPGYFPEERELFATDKQMTALDVPLRPIPSKVTITGRAGSTVTVDGAPRGILPFTGPIEVEAGQRSIVVSKSGFVTFAKDYDVTRGGVVSVKAELSRTRQRIASGFIFGAGITFIGFGALATLSAVGNFGDADLIGQKWNEGKTITVDELNRFNSAQSTYVNQSIASTILFNLGAASAGLGFLMYYFDDPKLPQVKPKKDDTTPKKETPGMRDMMFAPVTGPGYGGVTFSARF